MDDKSEITETKKSRGKVATLIARHELDGIGEEMEALWTRETEGRKSLRNLTDFFNKELLRAQLRRAGANPLDGEVANIYRLLSDDNVSSGKRVQAERTLEQHDIDVDQLRTEFVISAGDPYIP
ncbi:hypothetical protein C2R22_23815 (plasmid) [Salinigranum rubrum]|uniref:Uncharacterized protein n=1 Tax=Salinigranum rubrum TaxID=755307 RepID=A0A2I8VRX0_9EURY|nr:rod-determining factor RdfA [Salinigranum rubrum]AUV84671.1 hypothetical protein C2R22_23815 [Salinigranum rubrum]